MNDRTNEWINVRRDKTRQRRRNVRGVGGAYTYCMKELWVQVISIAISTAKETASLCSLFDEQMNGRLWFASHFSASAD
jgi:hypothetical protein